MKLNGRELDLSRPQVMTIVNVTDDSFYEGSRTSDAEAIERRVASALEQGAAIFDVGGYSSRPGADDIPPEEEWRRVERGLTAVRRIAGDIPVSVDTFRAEVARRAIESFGELIINDISAGELDPEIVDVAARYDAPYIAMHMRGTPQTMTSQTDYPAEGGGVLGAVLRYFVQKVAQSREAGIVDLILDPGFGFAKSVSQNFELLRRMNELSVFGLPILAGLSRKSLIWRTLGVTPDEALNGTSVLNTEALRQGAAILRVHDVREAVETVRLVRACSGRAE